MKAIKTRIKFYIVYMIVGIVLMFLPAICAAAGYTVSDYGTGTLSGIGGALVALSIIRLVQYGRMSKDHERAENWDNAAHEERTEFIVNKARAWTFYVSVFVELAIAMLAIFALDQKLLGQAFMLLACFQCFLSFILYRVLNNKY